MSLRSALGAAALTAAALGTTAAPASAAVPGWQKVGDYFTYERCEWASQYYVDGSTGHECRYNPNTWYYELWIGP